MKEQTWFFSSLYLQCLGSSWHRADTHSIRNESNQSLDNRITPVLYLHSYLAIISKFLSRKILSFFIIQKKVSVYKVFPFENTIPLLHKRKDRDWLLLVTGSLEA